MCWKYSWFSEKMTEFSWDVRIYTLLNFVIRQVKLRECEKFVLCEFSQGQVPIAEITPFSIIDEVSIFSSSLTAG